MLGSRVSFERSTLSIAAGWRVRSRRHTSRAVVLAHSGPAQTLGQEAVEAANVHLARGLSGGTGGVGIGHDEPLLRLDVSSALGESPGPTPTNVRRFRGGGCSSTGPPGALARLRATPKCLSARALSTSRVLGLRIGRVTPLVQPLPCSGQPMWLRTEPHHPGVPHSASNPHHRCRRLRLLVPASSAHRRQRPDRWPHHDSGLADIGQRRRPGLG